MQLRVPALLFSAHYLPHMSTKSQAVTLAVRSSLKIWLRLKVHSAMRNLTVANHILPRINRG